MKQQKQNTVCGYLFLLLNVFFLSGFYCQNTNTKSLVLEINSHNNDSVKVALYADQSSKCEIRTILTYVEPGIKICESKVDDKKLRPSLQRFFTRNHAILLLNKAVYFEFQGNLTGGLEYNFKALEIVERLDDKNGMASVSTNIANIFFQQNNLKQALKYAYKAFHNARALGDKRIMSDCIELIGQVQHSKGNLEGAMRDYKLSLRLREQIQDKEGISIVCNNLSELYREKGNDSLGLEYLNKAMAIQVERFDTLGLIHSYHELGLLLLKQNKLNEAYKNLSTSFGLAKKSEYPAEIAITSKSLSKVLALQGLYKEAYELAVLNKTMSDSLMNDKNKTAGIEKSLEYEYQKKELKSKLEQKIKLTNLKLESEKKNTVKNIVLSVVIFLLLIGVLLGLFFYRNMRQKQAIKELEKNALKQKLLLSQMSPHFIFNSVNNIQGLICNDKKTEAINYLDGFSELTRQILENSSETYISLLDEMEMIKNYLKMQSLLYNSHFDYHIEIDEAINQEAILIPPMLTQPFIENAIKHGLSNKNNNHIGMITISFSFRDNKLMVEITDNGVGFIKKEKSNNHKSLAISITKERLSSYLASASDIQFNNVLDINNEIAGAQVLFEIPYIYEQ